MLLQIAYVADAPVHAAISMLAGMPRRRELATMHIALARSITGC
jgi:hypothetical protein